MKSRVGLPLIPDSVFSFSVNYWIVRKWFSCILLLVVLSVLTLPVKAQPVGDVLWGQQIYTITNSVGTDSGRLVKMPNGNWLLTAVFFPGGYPTNASFIDIYVSTNNCINWTYLAQVGETPTHSAYTPSLCLDTNGNVLLTYLSFIVNLNTGWATNYHLQVYKSTNEGTNWNYLSTIDSGTSGIQSGLWEPIITTLPDGRLAAFYSNELHRSPYYSQIISERISPDNGATWGNEIWAVYQSGGGGLRPGMPQITRMTNGKEMLIFEVQSDSNPPPNTGNFKTSSDGYTWTTDLGTSIPGLNTGPFVMSTPDGRVFATSGSNNVVVSSDYGSTWTQVASGIQNFYPAYSFPSLYMVTPTEMAIVEGLRSPYNFQVGLCFGELAPLPVDPTTPARSSLALQDGRKMAFACAYPDGSIWDQWENTPGGTWSGWAPFTGTSGFRRLDAMQNQDGTLALFGVGDMSDIWMNSQTSSNGSWTGFQSLGGRYFQDLKAFRYNDGRYAVFGTDGNQVWVDAQVSSNGVWGGWFGLGGYGLTKISPILLPNQTFVVFAVGNGSPVWMIAQTNVNSGWTSWSSLGGDYKNVRAFHYNDGHLTVFAGDNNVIASITQTATNGYFGTWGGWQTVPGGSNLAQYDPIKQSNERFALLAVSGGSIWQNIQAAYNTNSWSGWTNLGGSGFSKLEGNQLSDGRLYYFANGLASPEWLRYQQVSNGVWYVNWTNLQGSIY